MTMQLRRFRELDEKSLNVELQMHTVQTDGSATVREILQQAHARGLSTVAFTEHARRDSYWFGAFARQVRAAACEFPELTVLVGCECKALDQAGRLDASPDILAQSDLVLGSVHRFFSAAGRELKFHELSDQEFAETECALALGLLHAAPIHVLAHPGGIYQRKRGQFPEPLMRRIMEASLERNIAIEINCSYQRDLPWFLRLCHEINPVVSIGSDVHKLEDVGRCRDILRQAGVTNALRTS